MGAATLFGQSGTPGFQWSFFFFPSSLSLGFFFLARSSKMPLLTPLPIKKVDYPFKTGQIGEVMFTILSLDLIGNIGRVSTLAKGWYVLPCVY